MLDAARLSTAVRAGVTAALSPNAPPRPATPRHAPQTETLLRSAPLLMHTDVTNLSQTVPEEPQVVTPYIVAGGEGIKIGGGGEADWTLDSGLLWTLDSIRRPPQTAAVPPCRGLPV